MKNIQIVLLAVLILKVQNQYLDEGKAALLSPKLGGAETDQELDNELTESDISKKKLKEFDTHAEMKMKVTDLPSTRPVESPTPAPTKIVEENTAEESTNLDINTTTSEEGLSTTVNSLPDLKVSPTPIPVKVDLELEKSTKPSLESKTKSQTKKPLGLGEKKNPKKLIVSEKEKPVEKVNNSTVSARKGVDESTVSARKGVNIDIPVDIKNATISARKEVDVDLKNSTVSPTKGVDIKISTVSAKKGVDIQNSTVSARKEASPDLIKPSVVGRKGAPKYNEEDEIDNLSPNSNVNTLHSNNKDEKLGKHLESDMVYVTSKTPKIVNNGTLIMVNKSMTTEPPSHVNSKPTAATDKIGDKDSQENDVSYTPAAIGIVLLLTLVLTVIVIGYRRLRDVWAKRHYARMDFLIDGMYDEY